MLKVSELYIYPIKSLPGIRLETAEVTDRGFKYDRRWMLVDEHNRFLSQREFAIMTQLTTAIRNNNLSITHKSTGESLIISLDNGHSGNWGDFTIWDDTCAAQYVNEEADTWFSKMLGISCRLIYMPDESKREVDQRYAQPGMVTSFADAYPFLLIGQASLNDLNSRLADALPMDRFRPNIVFTGGESYSEDLIGHFTIGDIDFYGVKLCARCIMTTIDQDKGTKGKEPLKTLASYRFKNNKIMFGQNLIHTGNGSVSVGDKMSVLTFNVDDRFIIKPQTEKGAVANIS